MRVLIIGPLGAGKSTLAYKLNQKLYLPRLNLDEISRNKRTGAYHTPEEQTKLINDFSKAHPNWVMEGSQKSLYEQTQPDVIVDMRVPRWTAIYRFTLRFIKAKFLQGQDVDPDLPVQPYHYRPIKLSTIKEWDEANTEINAQIKDFLDHTSVPVITCQGYQDHSKVMSYIKQRWLPFNLR